MLTVVKTLHLTDQTVHYLIHIETSEVSRYLLSQLAFLNQRKTERLLSLLSVPKIRNLLDKDCETPKLRHLPHEY